MTKESWNYKGLPIIKNKYIPDDAIFMLSDYHAGELVHDFKSRKTYVATDTGRLQTITPNIQNIPKNRDEDESVYLWEKCRERQRNSNFGLCDTCHERFRCWTACYPEIRIFKDGMELHQAAQTLTNMIRAQGITMSDLEKAVAMVSGVKI